MYTILHNSCLMSRSDIIVMEWHRVVLEIPFAGAFASNIYIYKWECNYNVTKSFPLFPCAQFIFLRHLRKRKVTNLVLRSNVDGHIHMRAYLSRETIITSFSLARVSIRTGSAVKLDNFQFHHYIRLHDLKFHIRCLSLCTSPSSDMLQPLTGKQIPPHQMGDVTFCDCSRTSLSPERPEHPTSHVFSLI